MFGVSHWIHFLGETEVYGPDTCRVGQTSPNSNKLTFPVAVQDVNNERSESFEKKQDIRIHHTAPVGTISDKVHAGQ